jgi:valyl-tRNA synthetase
MVKPVLYGESEEKEAVKECLLVVLETTLRLLHPFMPYVTEEIWQHIPKKDENSAGGSGRTIMTTRYPRSLPRDEAAEKEMTVIMEAVTGIRTIRGELNLSPSRELRVFIRTHGKDPADVLERNRTYLAKLAKADVVEIGEAVKKPKGSAAQVKSALEVYVPLEGLLNIDLEIDRLRKEEAKVDQTLAVLGKKLLNEDFLKRAPEDVVLKEKAKQEECLTKKERIREHIKKLYEAGGKE